MSFFDSMIGLFMGCAPAASLPVETPHAQPRFLDQVCYDNSSGEQCFSVSLVESAEKDPTSKIETDVDALSNGLYDIVVQGTASQKYFHVLAPRTGDVENFRRWFNAYSRASSQPFKIRMSGREHQMVWMDDASSDVSKAQREAEQNRYDQQCIQSVVFYANPDRKEISEPEYLTVESLVDYCRDNFDATYPAMSRQVKKNIVTQVFDELRPISKKTAKKLLYFCGHLPEEMTVQVDICKEQTSDGPTLGPVRDL